MPSLSVVVPVWNGARFVGENLALIADYLASRGDGELLVVDDGSSDSTVSVVQEAMARTSTRVPSRMLTNERNRGKGYSVRRGLLAARGDLRLFVDADLTYPCDNFQAVEQALLRGADLAVASRVHPDSRYVMAPEFFRHVYTRHHLGRLFNAVVQRGVVRGISDTQAGLKGFRRQTVINLLPRVKMERFAFDVELLFLAQRMGLRIEEVPVTFIYCKEPSSLQLARDGAQMLGDLLEIRSRARRGAYDGAPDLAAVVPEPGEHATERPARHKISR
ncbi:MAG TPA: glycosyltransferase [Polyangiaceae bacterium]|nr:glycosyltransferase [Polyangiaceae bacterium]